MRKFLAILIVSAAGLASSFAQYAQVYENANGFQVGRNAAFKVGFNGATPTVQRNGVAQAALSTVSATGTVTLSGTPAALTAATGVLTFGANPTAGDSVILGSSTYSFVSALSGTTSNQVVIGTTSAKSAQNLAGAINNTSNISQARGITYFLTGTTGNASASAAVSGTVLTATALTPGTAGNSIASTSSFTSNSNAWGGSTLSGGLAGNTVAIGGQTYTFAANVGAGTAANLVKVNGQNGSATNLASAVNGDTTAGSSYSSATAANSSVSASASSGVVTLTALLSGTAGNAIALAKSGSVLAVSGTVCTGGSQYSDVNACANLINELRAAMVQKGLIKGSQ